MLLLEDNSIRIGSSPQLCVRSQHTTQSLIIFLLQHIPLCFIPYLLHTSAKNTEYECKVCKADQCTPSCLNGLLPPLKHFLLVMIGMFPCPPGVSEESLGCVSSSSRADPSVRSHSEQRQS